MAVLALVLIAAWLLLVAGLRTAIQIRRTGETGAPRFKDSPGSPQSWARLLSTLGLACLVAAPLAELAGLALLVPNLLAAAALAASLIALQIQVRLVEEPYLRRVHGRAWDAYAARTGRFLPVPGRSAGLRLWAGL